MENQFLKEVDLKYHIFNSLFLRLPFDEITQTGLHIPILSKLCTELYSQGKSPEEIITFFFGEYFSKLNQSEQNTVLFNIIKYVERQVVLFDAVEDAAFGKVNDLQGPGTVSNLLKNVRAAGRMNELLERLENFNLHIVLTAHPTQFYPGAVLEIINNLNFAIQANDIGKVNELLMQLGKTPFLKRKQPTPEDEAESLIWYLENVFYDALSSIIDQIADFLILNKRKLNNLKLISLGFWPGGDRDGNPNVSADVTLNVVRLLQQSLLRLYLRDIRRLKAKLTFKGTAELLSQLEDRVHSEIKNYSGKVSTQSLIDDLLEIRESLCSINSGLFVDDLDKFRARVQIFGLHFATLDIRQDSRIHYSLIEKILEKKAPQIYEQFKSASITEKCKLIQDLKLHLNPQDFDEPLERDVIQCFYNLKDIQEQGGELRANRYIVSNCRSAFDLFVLQMLARWSAWPEGNIPLDFVPLFETISDLQSCEQVMEELYSSKAYGQHLKSRRMQQTVMLGFSDGTKDGGYLSANWSIYRAKENLSALSRKYKIKLAFFDGRGGPPARGGGNTNKFFSSLGNNIERDGLQLTIQGQTISSNFGTEQSARYNIEQLLCAGIENRIFSERSASLSNKQKELIETLAILSNQSYQKLKNNPLLLDYLSEAGPLDFYGSANIASRPVKRSSGAKLRFEDLRAIPFVGTWSQLKQNVPGYYGLGQALEHFEKIGELPELKKLYAESLFFQTLINNSMQSMCKSFFALTKHYGSDARFADLWQDIYKEFERSREYILKISSQQDLMDDSPSIRHSIDLRESTMLPLTTIQQYALAQLRKTAVNENPDLQKSYRMMVTRSMFGIINASRNSA